MNTFKVIAFMVLFPFPAFARDIVISPGDSLAKARDMARSGDRIILHGGTYRLDEPLVLGPQNSGVTWMAYPNETPVISGGVLVTGWVADADGRFKTKVNLDNFRQLWVNGQRAPRPRAPVPAGLQPWGNLVATVKKDTDRPDLAATPNFIPGTVVGFTAADSNSPGDIAAGYTTSDAMVADWKNPGDIEFGYMESVMHKIVKVEKIFRTGGGAVIEMAQPGFFLSQSVRNIHPPSPTYVENVFEYLKEPGQWYFDRPAHTLYYIPKPSEDMAKVEVIAPKLESLVEVRGAEDVKFVGLTFAHATWLQPSTAMGLAALQACVSVTPDHGFFRPEHHRWHPFQTEGGMSHANIVLDACRGVRFDGCTFTALGGSGLAIQDGSQSNIVSGCRFEDISCNGIMIGGVSKEDHHPGDPNHVTRDNQIVNNVITHTGVEYTDSVGVFYGYTDGTVIAHNEISALPYTAISGGWGWGITDAGGGKYRWPVVYQTPTTCRNNRIEYNRIYDIMRQHRDGGAVYLLGRQDNTHVRYNYVTDPAYPGAIYFDEGSAGEEASFNVIDPGCMSQVYDYGRGYGHNNYTPPSLTLGVRGKALKAGSTLNVPVPTEPAQFTLIAWIRLDRLPSGRDPRRWIACKTNSELADRNISLFMDGGSIAGSLNIGGGQENFHEAKSNTPVPLNQWIPVALTYDGGTLRVYCDGKEVGTNKIGKARTPGAGPLTIGSRNGRLGLFGCGDIDEVSFYDRVLTPDELKRNLDAKTAVVTDGLVANCDFETLPGQEQTTKIISNAGLEAAYRDISKQILH